VSTLWVEHAPSSVALARRSVLTAFDAAGLAGEPAHDAALIASELVGNAVRHATPLRSGRLALHWAVEPDGYSIAVTDGGRPTGSGSDGISARQAGNRDVGGRGLRIVAELADSWGVAAEQGGTTVWARGSRS